MTAVTIEPRRERKKRETRQRIVQAATRLFSERGFDGPTVDDIAAAADVAKGTIYNYFDSKEAILFEFLVEVEQRVQGELGRFAEAPGPLATIIADWLRYQFELKAPYLPLVRITLSQLVLRLEAFVGEGERVQAVVNPPLTALLEALQRRGLIPAGTDLVRALNELKSLHFGLSCLWAMEGPPFALTESALATQVPAFCAALERGEL